jgi:hypothetical protein
MHPCTNSATPLVLVSCRALHDLAPPTATTRHTIDGIVLTKFDVIDDKVCNRNWTIVSSLHMFWLQLHLVRGASTRDLHSTMHYERLKPT